MNDETKVREAGKPAVVKQEREEPLTLRADDLGAGDMPPSVSLEDANAFYFKTVDAQRRRDGAVTKAVAEATEKALKGL